MKRYYFVILSLLVLADCVATGPKKTAVEYKALYDKTVSHWTSYKDVERFLKSNFIFDYNRSAMILNRLRSMGMAGFLVRHHHKLFDNPRGFCADSANFALNALDDINPDYKARSVFIYNKMGSPHHWVTAFEDSGKLYVMDYGTGDKWVEMQGTHGPYQSLSEYEQFLSTLNIHSFQVKYVVYRVFPGSVD